MHLILHARTRLYASYYCTIGLNALLCTSNDCQVTSSEGTARAFNRDFTCVPLGLCPSIRLLRTQQPITTTTAPVFSALRQHWTVGGWVKNALVDAECLIGLESQRMTRMTDRAEILTRSTFFRHSKLEVTIRNGYLRWHSTVLNLPHAYSPKQACLGQYAAGPHPPVRCTAYGMFYVLPLPLCSYEHAATLPPYPTSVTFSPCS